MVSSKVIIGVAGLVLSAGVLFDSLFFERSLMFGERYNKIYPPSKRVIEYLKIENKLDQTFTRRELSSMNLETLSIENDALILNEGTLDTNGVFKRDYEAFIDAKEDLYRDESLVRWTSLLSGLAFGCYTFIKKKKKDGL